jgi:crotonobetainyl-CoA:carnitine CoA-transferase CaiB-like acyl-CoA transferase
MGGNGTDNDTAGGDEARSDRVDNDSSGDADVIAERWIAIACMTDDQWRCLRKLMDEPAWAQGSQFTTASGRYAHRASLDAHLGRWTQDQDAYELMARCQNAGVPAGVVQNGDDLAQRDPQLQAAEFLFAFDDVHPDLGPTFGDRLPLHFTKTECDTYTRVRALGEDNEAILRDWLGVTTEEFDQAEQQGWLQ